MLHQLRPALVILAALTVLTGVVYPLLITGVAQAAFARQANGSLVVKDGKVIGSELIGQPFDDPKYFWGRLSATTPAPYNAASSYATNFGPLNPALNDEVKGRIDALVHALPPAKAANGHQDDGAIPIDLVTSSGSGLDPHISPAAAEYQVYRVAAVRGLDEGRVRGLVAEHTEGRQLGILGEPTVNVLALNLALDVIR
jgi:K+-transporting ATPase ATPase C chain